MTKETSHTNLLEDERFLLCMKEILSTVGGRYVMRKLLDTYGVRQSTFTGNALTGSHAQGFQEAGILLEDVIENADASMFLLMLKENFDEQVMAQAGRKSTAVSDGGRK